VNAYIHVAKNPKTDKQTYKAGTGIGVTNRQHAELIAEKIGYDIKKVKFGYYPPGYPLRPLVSIQPYLVLDATKIKKDLKWAPTINLSDGIKKKIAYFKNQKL
jgi:nucleoside-diphosphate-sugar epimerase